jgi:SAM-dependent methyltransferase
MKNPLIEERRIEDLRCLKAKRMHNLRIEYAIKALQGCNAFLEVGCGEGFCTRSIVSYSDKPFLKVKGFDIDPERITVARSLWTDNGNISYEVGDACKPFPYRDAEFDAVILLDIMEHVSDPDFLVKECVRVLRKNGILFLVVPCEGEPYTLHGFFHKAGWSLSRTFSGHIQKLTKKKVLDMLEKEGLKTVWIRYSCHIIGQLVDMIGYEMKRMGRMKEDKVLSPSGKAGFYIMRKSMKFLLQKAAYFESKLFARVGLCALDLNICCRKE